MTQWKNYSAYYRGLRGHTVAIQRKGVEAYVKQRGGRIVSEYEDSVSGKFYSSRDEWVRRVRSDEVAIVYGLFVIAENAREGKRPSADYAKTIVRLTQCAGIIVDAQSGLTSDDGEAWANHVEVHAIKTAAGRQLSKQRARAMARKSHEGRPQAIVKEWHAPNMRAELKRWGDWYRSSEYPSARDAFDAMPSEIRAALSSLPMAIRVFGPRFPNGSKGGRPPKNGKPAARARVRYVYFIQRGATNEVKIGSAYNVQSRLGSLRTSSPDDLRLIGVLAGDETTESAMHAKFAKQWIRREWFKLAGPVADFVSRLPKMN